MLGATRSHRANAEPEVQGAGAAPHSGGTPATPEVREGGPGGWAGWGEKVDLLTNSETPSQRGPPPSFLPVD